MESVERELRGRVLGVEPPARGRSSDFNVLLHLSGVWGSHATYMRYARGVTEKDLVSLSFDAIAEAAEAMARL